MAKISEALKSVYPLATDFYIEIFDRKDIVLTGDIEITEQWNSLKPSDTQVWLERATDILNRERTNKTT